MGAVNASGFVVMLVFLCVCFFWVVELQCVNVFGFAY